MAPVAEAGAVIAVRFAAEEFERIVEQAAEADLTLTAFVREVVLARVAQRGGL